MNSWFTLTSLNTRSRQMLLCLCVLNQINHKATHRQQHVGGHVTEQKRCDWLISHCAATWPTGEALMFRLWMMWPRLTLSLQLRLCGGETGWSEACRLREGNLRATHLMKLTDRLLSTSSSASEPAVNTFCIRSSYITMLSLLHRHCNYLLSRLLCC